MRNRRDGSVEALLIGEEPRSTRYAETCRRGPVHAQVEGVASVRRSGDELLPFTARPTDVTSPPWRNPVPLLARPAAVAAVRRPISGRGQRQSLQECLCHPHRLSETANPRLDPDHRHDRGRDFHPALFPVFGDGRRSCRSNTRNAASSATGQAEGNRRGGARDAVLCIPQHRFPAHVLFGWACRRRSSARSSTRILPELLCPSELIGGNALIEAGTFLAILIGTIAGGLLILAPDGLPCVSATFWRCRGRFGREPDAAEAAAPPRPSCKINRNIRSHLVDPAVMRIAKPESALAVLGISWFWLVGAACWRSSRISPRRAGSQQPGHDLFLTLIRSASGGLVLVAAAPARRDHRRLVPWSALGPWPFGFDPICGGAAAAAVQGRAFMGAVAFLCGAAHWRIVVDLVVMALAGGI